MKDEFDIDYLITTMDEISRLEQGLEKLMDEQIFVEKLLAATKTLSSKTPDIVTASRVYLHYAYTGGFMSDTVALEQLMEAPPIVIREKLITSLEATGSSIKQKLEEWFRKLTELFNSIIAYNRRLEKTINKELNDGKLSDIRSMDVQAFKSITVPFFNKKTFVSTIRRLTAIEYSTVINIDKGGTFKEMVNPEVVNTLADVGQIITDDNYTYDKSKIETNKPISALGWTIDDLVPVGKHIVSLLNANAVLGRRAVKDLKNMQRALTNGDDITDMKKKVAATKKIYVIVQRTAVMLAKLYMQLVKRLKK